MGHDAQHISVQTRPSRLIPATCVIPVYSADRADAFKNAIDSILQQTLAPAEIIIAIDGPVLQGIEDIIAGLGARVGVCRSETNIGLPNILNKTLASASHEFVFRMDADDISCSDRFEKQWAALQAVPSLDLLGGQIKEFITDHKMGTSKRIVPLDQKSIERRLRYRNPFNHMTVVFRKSFVERVGGYRDIQRFEDYDLWARMISAGAACANMVDCLCLVRHGHDFAERRSGFDYAKSEIKLQRVSKEWRSDLRPGIAVCALRASARLLPGSAVKSLYDQLLRT